MEKNTGNAIETVFSSSGCPELEIEVLAVAVKEP